ncbi:NUDIX domain-containing protein [Nonomuraea sp. NPDC046570]|uniref:NUDIX domain-containing protein n=1 Tax=Nonomuraea sp. NPDC046570 TaxID=3155255 RepID=UPI0033F94A87
MTASETDDRLARTRLTELLGAVEPWDEQERADLTAVTEWVTGGAPLYRVRKPDVPATHLVSYFVVQDEERGELLLVSHRKAGLWLPSGGHVEPLEHPWDTVVRECREELRIEAVPSAISGERPFFVTSTRTRGPGPHTDVSLWFVLRAEAGDITSFDEEEFEAIRWLPLPQVLSHPLESLDPHMHRFTRKLLAAVDGVRRPWAGPVAVG